MDYTKSGTLFKLKKVYRYIQLYGLPRTIVKVRGQYHMKKEYNKLPAQNRYQSHTNPHVGLIGCGNFAFSNVAYYLNRKYKGAIRACMDKNIHAAASLYEEYKLNYYTDNAEDIISDPEIDTVYIASNHLSHAEYAIQCIRAKKNVHIEKPHVVNSTQLFRLNGAITENPEVKVFLGFNRTRSVLFRELQKYLNHETGPVMINWFIAGHEIPDDHWYFDEAEGGRVLGNLCHWTDLTLHLVGLENAFPCKIIPSNPENSKSDFVFSVIFADNSCAVISFSAKGHTFEGVREVLNIHKGDLLGSIVDFKEMTIDIQEKKIKRTLLFREHGHSSNIYHSYESITGEDPKYIHMTAKFFLAFKDAIDQQKPVELTYADAVGIH